MKNLIKIILGIFILIIFNISAFGATYVNLNLNYDGKNHKYNAEAVYLYINGNRIENLPMQPIIFNNSTLVPAREAFEALNSKVLWNKDTLEVEVLYQGNNIKMKIDEKVATVNGVSYEMPIPPKLINSKTMIPVRFVSEAIGLDVFWDGEKRIVNISNANLIETTTQYTTNEVLELDTKEYGIINSIDMPDSDEHSFSIHTDKKINKYEVVKLNENEYALDLYNFKNGIKESTINSVSNFVSKILIEEKDDFTRLIFNLITPTFYDVSISLDEKILNISFGGNIISKIEKYNNQDSDILKIYSEYNPKYTLEKKDTENKVILKLENVYFKNIVEDFKDTKYITDVKYYQDSDSILNVEVYFSEQLEIDSKYDNNTLILTIGKSIQKQPIFTQESIVIPKNSNIPIDINSIIQEDNYLNKKYILNFNTDISSLLPLGTHKINNNLVNNILVENISNKTRLTINCNQIIAVNLTEDNSNIYIEIVKPKEKYKNIVVIDPGHGGSDPGTSGLGLKEKDIVLDISNKLINLIDNDDNIKVYSSRISDVYPSFDDRTSLGNEVGDMFVSIHINAPGNPNNTTPSGTEVYYLNFNTSERGINSKVMADTFQKNIVNSIATKDRGTKTANFKVLRDSKIPAVLCEIAFITNPEDNKKLASNEYRQKIADALYKSIKELFEKYPSK